MKVRALSLLVLLLVVFVAPVGSLGYPTCADDCSPDGSSDNGRPCSYACACCPCCQLPAGRVAQPEILLGLSVVFTYVQPLVALASSEPRAVLHVPKAS